jgi:hypothetical protein
VASRFADAFTETFRAERALGGDWAKRAYPGKKAANHAIWMNLSGHLLIDPRALIMFSQAATVKAYGVYFGADKFTHFHQLGWSYYKLYRSLQREGLSDEEAYRKVLIATPKPPSLRKGTFLERSAPACTRTPTWPPITWGSSFSSTSPGGS